MKKIRLGILGCGGMGRSHALSFKNQAQRMVVTAAVDIAEERRRMAAEALPEAKVVADYHDIFDDVDAVLIALPHHLHHMAALDCLAAGKHVLLEKPMANTEQECLDIIAAKERGNGVLMVAYCMRFDPMVRRLKELLDAKAYGECFQMSLWTEQHTEYPPESWASRADKLGGGQLFSHGCHYIDLLLWFLGKPVRGIHLGTNLGTPWMEKEGTSNVTIAFEGGVMGYHFGTWGARGSRLKYSFHAHCTGGMLELAYSEGKLIAHTKAEEHVDTSQATHETEKVLMERAPMKHTEAELIHFLDCIETGREPLTNARDSLQGLRVIWRLYEAEDNNTMADLRGLGLAGT